MIWRVAVVAVLLVLISLASGNKLQASMAPGMDYGDALRQPSAPADSETKNLLVKFRKGVSDDQKRDLHQQLGGKRKEVIPGIEVEVVEGSGPRAEALARVYAHHPWVQYAEVEPTIELIEPVPVEEFQLATTDSVEVNDPYFVNGYHWNLEKIQAPEAWGVTTGDPDVKIAIIDTGINYDHEDLASKVVSSANFTFSSTCSSDKGEHGTMVAGVASAATNNGVGVASIGYNSSLMNVKAIPTSSCRTSDLLKALVWAADNGASVYNMSWGYGGAYPAAYEDALNYAWSKGVVLVAAAGNDASSNPQYPAAYENVIAVASTGYNDELAPSSNYGDWVDVAAPGVTYTTLADGGYRTVAGTSIASPHVAGLAALLFTVVTDTNGNGRLNDEVRACIENNADDVGVNGIGHGRINAYRAVLCPSASPPPSDTTPPTVSITSPSSSSFLAGTVTFRASASDASGVSKVEFYRDNVLIATDTSSPYQTSWNTGTVAGGPHTLLAKAYDVPGNIGNSSPVSVTVDNTSPTAALTSPQDGATVAGTVSIAATASDNIAIARVDFYLDGGIFLVSDPVAPYTVSWDSRGVADGSHTLSARAVDGAGNTAASASIAVITSNGGGNPAPSISITSPLAGAVVPVSSTVTITATSPDAANVKRVEFYVNGNRVCNDLRKSPPVYTCFWRVPSSPGRYELQARAYNAAGNVGSSPILTVTSK